MIVIVTCTIAMTLAGGGQKLRPSCTILVPQNQFKWGHVVCKHCLKMYISSLPRSLPCSDAIVTPDAARAAPSVKLTPFDIQLGCT
jgi:hypothetical protein